jgi:uncharacterized integral membrane protein
MLVFRRFLSLLVLVLLFVFCVFNTQPVVLRFPGWEGPQLPLFLPLLTAFFAGVLLALLGQSLRSVGRKLQPRKPQTPPPEEKTPSVADQSHGDEI